MPRTMIPKTPKGLAQVPGQRRFDAQTLSMFVAMASELTVTRARLDAVERLLANAGVLPADAVDNYDPDPSAQAERDALRQRSMRKIFRAMLETAESELQSLDNDASLEKSS